MTCNEDLSIGSDCTDCCFFFPVHAVYKACTENTSSMLNCDHEFMITAGLHADRVREILFVVR